jgi:transposase InsO family protein
MDVWSRRIVGWRIAQHESADVAAALIAQSCSEGNIDPRGLVLHSDNGTPMRCDTQDIALTVPSTRGSVAGRKPTRGIMRRLASRSFDP